MKYVLPSLMIVASFFAWFSIYRAMKIPEASIWLVPAFCFSLYVISICLVAVMVRQEIVVELAIAFSFLLSLVFTFSIGYLLILILCTLFMLYAVRNIRKDLDLNVKINLWKSLYTGKFKIALSLAIIISSQFFFFVSKTDGQKTVPKFDVSSITSKLVKPILGIINPEFKKIEQDGITVDQFILIESKKDILDGEEMIYEQIPYDLPNEQKEALKQQALQQINDLMLQTGRQNLSQITEKNLKGDEKIGDVFVGFIDKRINDYFQPKVGEDAPSSLLAYIVSMILFLTIWPIGSILALIWFVVVIIIFKILLYFGLVKIKTITVEREMIA